MISEKLLSLRLTLEPKEAAMLHYFVKEILRNNKGLTVESGNFLEALELNLFTVVKQD